MAASREALVAGFRGQIIEPDDAGYDEARAVYNAMIDKRPAMIARCRDAADVIAAVNYGRESGMEIAIRGGGHNGPGLGTVEGGLVIDLAPMNGVRVMPGARLVVAQGGCTLGDIDHATHAFGMATPAGIISTTGMGLALGGGVGHLTRKCGLTIDNLVGADVVLADGSHVSASESENPDLFWAIRGGGGNFGVVTALVFRLHRVGDVMFGPTLFPLERTEEVMRWYRDYMANLDDDDMNGFFAFLTVPPAEPFPEELHMERMCGIVWCYGGPPEKADEAFAPVRALEPALDGVMPAPVPAMNSAFDELYPKGYQWYWRADFVKELPDEAIAEHAKFGAAMPKMHSTMHLYPIDGAASRVPAEETPWTYRDAKWAMVMVGVDPDPANAETVKDWAISYHEAVQPYTAGGAYLNMIMDEGQDRVKASYGDNYDRLAKIKAKYDPDNLFRVNQNIHPAA